MTSNGIQIREEPNINIVYTYPKLATASAPELVSISTSLLEADEDVLSPSINVVKTCVGVMALQLLRTRRGQRTNPENLIGGS